MQQRLTCKILSSIETVFKAYLKFPIFNREKSKRSWVDRNCFTGPWSRLAEKKTEKDPTWETTKETKESLYITWTLLPNDLLKATSTGDFASGCYVERVLACDFFETYWRFFGLMTQHGNFFLIGQRLFAIASEMYYFIQHTNMR